jgi:2,3-bisphosphoglycerate-dependent phosphoglycerate mutase
MRYAGLPEAAVPQGESLAQVVTRVAPVWTQCLQPAPATGQRVLVTAHGNSLRALIKLIEGIADADIARLEIPTAVPNADRTGWRDAPLRSHATWTGDTAAVGDLVDRACRTGPVMPRMRQQSHRQRQGDL